MCSGVSAIGMNMHDERDFHGHSLHERLSSSTSRTTTDDGTSKYRLFKSASIIAVCAAISSGCHGLTSPEGDSSPYNRLIPIPAPTQGVTLANSSDTTTVHSDTIRPGDLTGNLSYYTLYAKGSFTLKDGDQLQVIFLATDQHKDFMVKIDNGLINPWLSDVGLVKKVFFIPEPQQYFIRTAVPVTFHPQEIGVTDQKPIQYIQVIEGSNIFGYATSASPFIFDRIDRLYGPSGAVAMRQPTFPFFDEALNSLVPRLLAAEQTRYTFETTRESWLQRADDRSLGLVVPASHLASDSIRRIEVNLYATEGSILNGADVAIARGVETMTFSVLAAGTLANQNGHIGIPTVLRADDQKLSVALDVSVLGAATGGMRIQVTPKSPPTARSRSKVVGFVALQRLASARAELAPFR